MITTKSSRNKIFKPPKRRMTDDARTYRLSALFIIICRLEEKIVRTHLAMTMAFLDSELNSQHPYRQAYALERALDYQLHFNEYIGLEDELRATLTELGWPGSDLPGNPEEWPGWWTAVRKFASQFRLGENHNEHEGLVEKHNLK